MRTHYILLAGLCLFSLPLLGQHKKTDANIMGHVTSGDDHLPFATILIKGTLTGTTTDETGHYQLINLTPGKHTLVVRIIGYLSQEKTVEVLKEQTIEVNFDLTSDILGLEEVVITGDRNERNRKESVTSVSTIHSGIMEMSRSVTISEGLNFCTGLRTENNCQNCGFNQVRMNGLEGAYSQILIDGRPVFSGLASVYGLELIPSSMIRRIEVVKGGGSVLYGSNAIAGTINLILGEPVKNSYEFGMSGSLTGTGMSGTGGSSPEFNAHMNGSVLSGDQKSGLSLFGFYRTRKPFDANNDGYSEISKLWNLTVGTRLFHRFGSRSKLTGDFFAIHEARRGGNKFGNLPHETDITESATHTMLNGSIESQTYLRHQDMLTLSFSMQHVNRDSYYGANMSLKDYGHTTDLVWVAAIQYLLRYGKGSLTTGAENQRENLRDQKLGYPDLENAMIVNDTIVSVPHTENTCVANQTINTAGIFAQYEHTWGFLTAQAGLRYDYYLIRDCTIDSVNTSRGVIIPRISLKADIGRDFRIRAGYAQGYRAPQIFDEDLHIETSGARQVLHRNAPGLKQETSHSIMISLDYSSVSGKGAIDLQAEVFLTFLKNPFAYTYSLPDSAGRVVYTRYNSDHGASVYGVNLQANASPVKTLTLNAGFTWQQSLYEDPQEFDEKRFFRTPSTYGFLILGWNPFRRAEISSTLNYTGPMLLPYFGPDQADPVTGELKTSEYFFDWGVKLSYSLRLNGASMQFFAGMKNILNSYQRDFDTGIDRDPGYIYGPMFPRTIYAGLRFGNML